jgi:hypothetical protein
MPSVYVMGSTWTLVSVEAKNHSFSPASCCCCAVCLYVFMSCEHVCAVCVCNGFDLDAGKRRSKESFIFSGMLLLLCRVFVCFHM